MWHYPTSPKKNLPGYNSSSCWTHVTCLRQPAGLRPRNSCFPCTYFADLQRIRLPRPLLLPFQPTMSSSAHGKAAQDHLSIVGLGLRLPGGARDADSFWRILCSTESAIGEIPSDRGWTSDEFVAPPKTRADSSSGAEFKVSDCAEVSEDAIRTIRASATLQHQHEAY